MQGALTLKDNQFQVLDTLLSEKIELLKQLAELTRKQSSVIEGEQLEELQVLIDKKMEIMKTVDRLDESLNPILDKVRTFVGLKNNESLAKIEKRGKLPAKTISKLKSLGEILQELQKIDQENLSKMNEKREELAQRMLEIQSGRKANKGYKQDSRIYSTYIDRKG